MFGKIAKRGFGGMANRLRGMASGAKTPPATADAVASDAVGRMKTKRMGMGRVGMGRGGRAGGRFGM